MTNQPTPPLAAFVTAAVEIGGQLASILDHMHRYSRSGHSAPGAPPPPVVLAELLGGALRPLSDELAAGELETATRVLARAGEHVEAELFLVEPPGRRARSRRRR